jgi:hypothetical protein
MMRHEQEIEGYILDGMARALWVHAYMVWATEVDPPPVLHEATWEELAPDTSGTRSGSMKAAKELAKLIARANSLYGPWPLDGVFDTVEDRMERGGTQADRALAFGAEVARLATGTTDRQDSVLQHRPDIAIPTFKIMLDDDGHHLSWDGGWPSEPDQLESNPSRWQGSEIQSLLFDARRYSVSQAKRWAQDHGLKYGSVDSTENYHRLRQFDPGDRRCRTIELGHDIKAIVCETRNPSEMDIRRFASIVNSELPYIVAEPGPESEPWRARGRFGRKVFISALWRQLRTHPQFKGVTLEQFKRNLYLAHKEQLLTLARADLVAAMDPSEVAESEYDAGGARFNFVVDK